MNYFDYIREYLDKKPSLICVPVRDKAPILPDWNNLKPTQEDVDKWEEDLSGQCNGLGLLAGQHNIGYADYDTDDGELIHRFDEFLDISQICTKRGKKGKTVFFRYDKTPKKSKYYAKLNKTDRKPILEVNLTIGQTVLPPSIHPETRLPYKWVSQSLLDLDIEDLPILDIDKLEYLQDIVDAKTTTEAFKNVPTGVTGEGSGKWLTMTSECSRLLHHGHNETEIARTLVGMDRRLFPNNQFFLSNKIGKALIGDDYENAIMWVTEYKLNIMRQDKDLRETLKSIAPSRDAIITSDIWPDPDPLVRSKKELEFPDDLFPRSLKEHCKTLSQLSAIPPEAYLAGLLTSFSACTQGKVIIHAKKEFIVRPSISAMIVAPSGSRKDSVFDWSREPLRKLIKRDKENYKGNSVQKEQLLTEKLIQLDKKFKKAIQDNDQIAIDEITKEKIESQTELANTKIKKSNFIFESGTQERLYKLMEENQHRGIFICSSEFVQMLGVMGKKGNEALKPFLIKLFNGSVSESFTHQTIGGTNVDIEKCYGCSLTSVQNDVLSGFFDMISAGHNNDGFIQRFFLIPINPKVERMVDIEYDLDTSLVDNVFALLYDHEGEIHVEWENQEAKDAYFDYDVLIRERAENDISFIKSFRTKYSGQSVKLAWIFAQLDAPKGIIVNKISKKYFLMAVKWLEWQSRILDVTYGNMTGDGAIKDANSLLDTIMTSADGIPSTQLNTLSKLASGKFRPALELLISKNYVKLVNGKIVKSPKL